MERAMAKRRRWDRNETGVTKPRSKITVIRGVVVPTDWDDKGNVISIAISSHDENVYHVDRRGKGSELLRLIRKEVEVRGVVREEENKKVIAVRKCSISEPREPEGILSR